MGNGMPIATSVSPTLKGPSAPTRMSLTSRSRAPIAKAWPVLAEMIGSGCSYMVHSSSAPSATNERMASSDSVMTERSKPAENFPRGRSARSPGASPAARSKASWSASSVAGPTTFALPSSWVITATSPSSR